MARYQLSSVKGKRSVDGALADAFAAATAMDDDLQPLGGVTIERRDGSIVGVVDGDGIELDGDIEELRDAAGTAGDLEQVRLCDLALSGDRAAIIACAAAMDDAWAADGEMA